jgi:hypothetical protein
MSNNTNTTNTAGSIAEQFANAEMNIATARQQSGGGFEAVSLSGLVFRTWSPTEEAAVEVARQAFQVALDPGSHVEIERVTENLCRRAELGRAALRDAVVPRHVDPAYVAIQKQLSLAVAGLTVSNAGVTCQAIIRNTIQVVEHLQANVQADMKGRLTDAAVLKRIDEAVVGGDESLAALIAALGRVKNDAEAEVAKIDQDLREAQRMALQHEQVVKIRATEASRSTIFGRERAVQDVVREVTTRIPSITNERLATIYLPPVRDGMPVIGRCAADSMAALEGRRAAIEEACRTLGEEAARVVRDQTASGRVRIVGAPQTEAARRAAVGASVEAVLPALRKELRDLIVWKAPPAQILAEVLGLARAQLRAQQPVRSIDEVLLEGHAPHTVALQMDQEIQRTGIPLGLVPGAGIQRLRELRCLVMRVPPGSPVAQALVAHAKYQPAMFSETAPLDTIEVLTWQPGIHLHETRIYVGGEDQWNSERNTPGTAPLAVLAPALLSSATAPDGSTPSSAAGTRRRVPAPRTATEGGA